MSLRLIDLRTICAEKITRSRAWIYAEIAAGRFPKPLPLKNSTHNLWRESDVDAWLVEFVANVNASAQTDSKCGPKFRMAKARSAKQSSMAAADA